VLTGQVIESALHDSMDTLHTNWATPAGSR
jgi:hypothetical protein